MKLASGLPRPAWRAARRAPHAPSPRSREAGPPSQARGAYAPHTPPAQGMCRARKPPRNPGWVAPPPQGAQASCPESRTPRAQGERRCGRRGPPRRRARAGQPAGTWGRASPAGRPRPAPHPPAPAPPFLSSQSPGGRLVRQYSVARRGLCQPVVCYSPVSQSSGSACPAHSIPSSRGSGGLGQRRRTPIRWLRRPLAPRREMRYRSCVPQFVLAGVQTGVSFRPVCSCESVRLAPRWAARRFARQSARACLAATMGNGPSTHMRPRHRPAHRA